MVAPEPNWTNHSECSRRDPEQSSQIVPSTLSQSSSNQDGEKQNEATTQGLCQPQPEVSPDPEESNSFPTGFKIPFLFCTR
jgi:hypothetical protein